MKKKTASEGMDAFARHCGIELVESNDGYARAKMPISQSLLSEYKNVQAGAIFSLADFTFGHACQTHQTITVGVNTTMSLVKSCSAGTLWADVREVSKSSNLSSCVVHITDDQGDLIAIFQGTAYRKTSSVEDIIGQEIREVVCK